MTTAIEIMTPALEKAGMLIQGQSPNDNLKTRALEILNDMIAQWKSQGLDLQLDTLSSSTSTVYLDPSDMLALKFNLAVLLADHYNLPLSARTERIAKQLYGSLVGKYLEAGLENMSMPVDLRSRRYGRYNIENG